MELFSFENLQNQYGFFINPASSLSVNGTAMANYYAVKSLCVEQTTDVSAIGTLTITLACKENAPAVIPSLADFPLMGIIKLALGYEERYTPVFEGLLFERDLALDGSKESTLTLTCLDKKALLTLQNAYTHYASVQTISTVAEQLISGYGLTPHIGKTPQFAEPVTITRYGDSDFDFLAGCAQDLGYEFFVLNQDAFFRSPADVTDVLIALETAHMYTLSHHTAMNRVYAGLCLQLHDRDKAETRLVTVDASGPNIGSGKTGADIWAENNLKSTKTESVHTYKNFSDSAEKQAAARLWQNSLLLTTLTVQINGLPEIKPGYLLKIANVAPATDNLYYIVKTRHIVNADGYRTEITACANTTAQ